MGHRVLSEVRAVLLGGVERARLQWIAQADHRSLNSYVTATKHVPAMEEPQLSCIASQLQRLPGIDRHGADAKSPGIRRLDPARNFSGQRGIDELPFAQDQKPVRRSGI